VRNKEVRLGILKNNPDARESHQFDIALPTSPWQHMSALFKQAW
jgi:hypothetical protein